MSEETNFDVLNGKLDKILALLSERSKDVFEQEIVSEHVSGVNLEDNVTVTEQMLMDLTEVTVIAQSGKAFLVLKKGYQKWIPYSQLYDVEQKFENGQFLQNLPLNEKAEKWMHNKPWEKFKAVKNRQ